MRVRRHQVTVPAAARGARPLRIGFAADFHAGPMTSRALVEQACGVLADARPDLLLLGGDFVDLTERPLEWLVPLLAAVPAPAGRYAVMGNHDLWNDRALIEEALASAGICTLVNAGRQLPAPFDWAWVCGLDDHLCGAKEPDAAFAGASGTRIVLMHSPSSLLDIGPRRFDLALCGHTHGGQIALPGGRPIILPKGPLSRRYSRGRFELPRGETLLVSTGVGFTRLPIRLFAEPEVLVCDVMPCEGSAP